MINYTPVQERYLEAQRKSRKARALAERNKPLNDKLDAFFHGKATDNTSNYDKQEINSWISP